jgi:thymidylate kinase
MNLVIFEGIASTGKSTLISLLKSSLEIECVVSVLDEHSTLMPIIQNKDKHTAIAFLNNILNNVDSKSTDIILLDRFHVTHVFRTESNMEEFIEIEEYLLEKYKPILVLLTLKPDIVNQRIAQTIAQRGAKWGQGKQGSMEEKVEYYTKQQEKLLEIFNKSRLPKIQVDTSEKKWEEYLKIIRDQII